MSSWSSSLDTLAWPKALQAPEPAAARGRWVAQARALYPGMVEAMQATPQDHIHHAEGDVWTHTQMVVDELLALPGYAAASPARRGVLFHAAILHDVSKPQTTRELDGRIVAPGHSAKGAIQARKLLWEHEAPFVLREQVCRLIEVHQLPFYAFNDRRQLGADYTARWLSCDRSIELLCLLAEADMRGRICNDQQRILDEIALFGELASELGCLDAPYAFPDAATRMAYLGSQGARYPDEPVYRERNFEVVMLSGLPAAGKSTWVQSQDLPSVSYDDIRDELGFRHGKGTGTIVHEADDRMREFLRKQEPFVVNATHLSKQMRRRTLGLLRDYGASVRVVYFEAPRHDLLARNQARNSTLTNDKLLSMLDRWEVPGLDEADTIELAFDPKILRPGPVRCAPGR